MKEFDFQNILPDKSLAIEPKLLTAKKDEMVPVQLNPAAGVIEINSSTLIAGDEKGGLLDLNTPALSLLRSIRAYFVQQAMQVYEQEDMFDFVDRFFGGSLTVNVGLGAVVYTPRVNEPEVLLGDRSLENSWSPGWVFPSETVDEADWEGFLETIPTGKLFQNTLKRLVLEELTSIKLSQGEIDDRQAIAFNAELSGLGFSLKAILERESFLLTTYLDTSAGSLWLIPVVAIPLNYDLKESLLVRIQDSKEWQREFKGEGNFYPLTEALDMVKAAGPSFALRKLQERLLATPELSRGPRSIYKRLTAH